MRRTLTVALFALPLLAAPHAHAYPLAERAHKTLEQRNPKVLLRASKMGYAKGKQLKTAAVTLGRRYDSAISSLHGDSIAAYASWQNAEAAISGQKDPYTARQNISYYESQVREMDKLLETLPYSTTEGLRIGSLFQNPQLQKAGQPRLQDSLKSISTFVRSMADNKTESTLSRVEQIERHLVARMDDRYVSGHAALTNKIAGMAPAVLYQHALSLIHQIDGLAHDKDIAREEIERGSSSSKLTSRASGSGASVQLSGNKVTGGSREEFSSYTEGRSQSSYTRDQLLLHAVAYKVKLRNVRSEVDRDKQDQRALTPVEARMLTGLMLDLHDVMRVLQKKDTEMAAPISGWVEHSTLSFVTKDYNGRDVLHTFGLGHAPQDTIKRQNSLGFISEKLANHLDRESKKSLNSVLEKGSSLWD